MMVTLLALTMALNLIAMVANIAVCVILWRSR